MRIFVTGSDGLLGQEIARVFSDHELYLGSHQKDDITQEQVIEAIVKFKSDVVIHTAAVTDVDECEISPEKAFRVNELGSRHVAIGAQECRAVLVAISTDYVFDGNQQAAYEETDQPNPMNVYGQSKWAGERAIQSTTRRYFILRTSWLYGKGGKNFVYSVLHWAKKQPILKLVHDKTGSPTYAKDLARVIRQLLGTQAYGLYHASGLGACTWYEYGQEILKIAGIEKETVSISFEELRRPAKRPSYSVLRNGALNRLGFSMRPWPVALQEFLESEF